MPSLISTPPLIEGDALTNEEFLRRWEEMPDVKHAELIDGIVCMPSPVSLGHGDYQSFFGGWLFNYCVATSGCRSSLEGTWLMDENQTPQPDVTLRILPEFGGQSKISGVFPAGAPELIVEIAVSSYSRDFGTKRRLYERMGVREYLIAVPREEKLVYLGLTPDGYRPYAADTAGIFRSVCFPGLWLHVESFWRGDLQSVNSVLQQGLDTPEHSDFVTRLATRRSF